MIDLTGINMVTELEGLGIKFKKAGSRSWAAVCPLHADTDPSFHVYQDGVKDKFKCFGCHKHGDIIDFYMAYHHCDWNTAAAKVGVKPEKQDRHHVRFLKKQSEIMAGYETWKVEMLSGLNHLLELALDAMTETYIPENLHEAGTILKQIERWNLWKNILLSGDDDEIARIYTKHKTSMKPVTDFVREDFERRAYR